MEREIAYWQSRGGKYAVTLYYNPEFKLADGRTVIDAHYRGTECGGVLVATSVEDAVCQLQAKIDRGHFQPDAAKTPMRRIR